MDPSAFPKVWACGLPAAQAVLFAALRPVSIIKRIEASWLTMPPLSCYLYDRYLHYILRLTCLVNKNHVELLKICLLKVKYFYLFF